VTVLSFIQFVGVRSIGRRLLLMALLAPLVGACTSGGQPAHRSSSTSAPASSSTLAPGQASGERTVLSPIGVNVRAEPSMSAKVLGTAAQGAVLTTLGHVDANGGWYQVRGATVTGWISADPTLSAPGEFRTYTSGLFSALYPATWTSAESPPASVVFRSDTGPENIVVTGGPSEAKLPQGRDGYGQSGSRQIVVCGVTSDLVTYQQAESSGTTPPATAATTLPFLAEILLTVDAQHALGVYGNLSDLGPQLQTFQAFAASLVFPSKQCTG
jgi:Bacterial SH3 domain